MRLYQLKLKQKSQLQVKNKNEEEQDSMNGLNYESSKKGKSDRKMFVLDRALVEEGIEIPFHSKWKILRN